MLKFYKCTYCGKNFLRERRKSQEEQNIYDDTFIPVKKFCSLECCWQYRSEKGGKGQFKKGSIPWNKGLTGKGICKSNSGSFKKGQKGINWMPIRSITIRIDKSGKKRRWIKIKEPNIWIEYAKFVWRKSKGRIPRGYIIHHIDENPLNDDIKNLQLLTRKEHFEIHGIGELGRKARMANKRIKNVQMEIF